MQSGKRIIYKIKSAGSEKKIKLLHSENLICCNNNNHKISYAWNWVNMNIHIYGKWASEMELMAKKWPCTKRPLSYTLTACAQSEATHHMHTHTQFHWKQQSHIIWWQSSAVQNSFSEYFNFLFASLASSISHRNIEQTSDWVSRAHEMIINAEKIECHLSFWRM
jgi:hypothetical protein